MSKALSVVATAQNDKKITEMRQMIIWLVCCGKKGFLRCIRSVNAMSYITMWILVLLFILILVVSLASCVMYIRLMRQVRSTIQSGAPVPRYDKLCVPPCPSQHFRYKLERVSMEDPIPRTIHQLWKSQDVPDQYQRAVASCKRLNPTWEYRLWTDDDIDQFIAWEYPFFYEAFQSYPYQIQRVDAARYFILLHHGGVTIDIDLECKTPLDEILANKTGHDLVVPETDPFGVTVEFMAAKPGRPFLLHVVMDLYSNMANYILPYVTIIFTTGPMYLTNRMVDYPKHEEIYVIPQEIYRTKYFRNLHGGSWHRWDSALIKSVYTLTSPFVFVPVAFIIAFLIYIRLKNGALSPMSRLYESHIDNRSIV